MTMNGVAFFLAGIIMAIITLCMFISRKSMEKHGLQASGTVIGEKERKARVNNRTVTYYDPLIEYITQNGQKLQTSLKIGTAHTTHPVGTKVQILYKDNNPQKIQEADSTSSDRALKIVLIIALVLLAIGLVMWFI